MTGMYDVVIIGAGAAGLMAAGVASRKGYRTLVVEKMEKAGRKIRISGKGRCNVTNTAPAEQFLSKVKVNSDFFKPSFSDFDNRKTLNFFRKEGLDLIIERGGRVFPESGRAWDVADALVDWATEGGAEIMYNTKVTGLIATGGKIRGVRILTKKGYERNVESGNVIICTGGASYPATGSTGDGYRFARAQGHRIMEIRPALVPLESDSPIVKKLTGLKLKNVSVSLLVEGSTAEEEFGEMEFTQRGIEGAVILKLSRTAVDALRERKNVEISIDLKSALDEETLKNRISRETEAMPCDARAGELLRKLMPKQMVAPMAEYMGISTSLPVSSLDDGMRDNMIRVLKDLRLHISGHGQFEEAVVTAGGVSVESIDPYTLQSRLVGGLYFAGELLDIDADTGGYNLQIAFSTGHLAGKLKKAEEGA